MTTIDAAIDDIKPRYNPYHDYSESRVQAIINHLAGETDEYGDVVYGPWDLPPVVVVDDLGNGYMVLDGHHRMEAAKRLEVQSIPAWVVSVSDFDRLIDDEFDGSIPSRLYEVREYILCGPVSANEVSGHGE